MLIRKTPSLVASNTPTIAEGEERRL